MKCTQCGSDLLDGALFCGNCGNRVQPVVFPPVEQPPVIVPPVEQPPVIVPPVEQPPVIVPPVEQPPVIVPPVEQPPVIVPPVEQPPVMTPPIVEPPIVEPPVVEPPVVEPPEIPDPPQTKKKKDKPVKPPKEPRPKKVKAPKSEGGWHPGPVARVFLRLLSILLCLCMFSSLLATVLVIDMRLLMDQDNLSDSINNALMGNSSKKDGSVLNDGLVSLLYGVMEDEYGDKMTTSEEELQEFVNGSSSSVEYISDLTASLMSDFINGTEKTRIRSSDIIDLIEENEELIEETFGKDMEEELKQEVLDLFEEKDVEELIHDEVFAEMRKTSIFGGKDGYTISNLLSDLENLTSTMTLIILIVIDLLLVGLLLLSNWLRVGATMRCVSTSMMSVGVLVAVPTLLIQLLLNWLVKIFGGIVSLAGLFIPVIAPVHYITLLAGVLLFIISLIVSFIGRMARP